MHIDRARQALVNRCQKNVPNTSKIQPVISYYLALKRHKVILLFLRKSNQKGMDAFMKRKARKYPSIFDKHLYVYL